MPTAGLSSEQAFNHLYKSGMLNYTTAFIIVSNNSTADAFGAWTQLIADSGNEPILLYMLAASASSADTNIRTEIELGIGASGAEKRISGFAYPNGLNTSGICSSPISRIITPNTRVSARVRDSAAVSRNYKITLLGASIGYLASVGGINAPYPLIHAGNIENNYPTAISDITSTTTANTFGAWVELIPNVGTRPVLLYYAYAVTTSTTFDARWEIELGVGDSGAETTICSFGNSSTPSTLATIPYFLFVQVPANSRISARARNGGSTAVAYRVGLHYLSL